MALVIIDLMQDFLPASALAAPSREAHIDPLPTPEPALESAVPAWPDHCIPRS